jgi:hypothetical protein
LASFEPVLPDTASSTATTASGPGSPLRRIFATQKNKYGLFRKFFGPKLPSHNPDEDVSLHDLSDIPEHSQSKSSDAKDRFYPYPNASTFRLGDWYWNNGAQNSQSSFKKLVNIIADPEFSPADVRAAKWDQLNEQLAGEDQEEWMDTDAGWTHTPITIPVPYHPRRGVPSDGRGPRDYVVTDFYHRSLVSVIREKLSNKSATRHFHYEPYELHWQPGHTPQSPTQ